MNKEAIIIESIKIAIELEVIKKSMVKILQALDEEENTNEKSKIQHN